MDNTEVPTNEENVIVQGPRQRSAQWGDLMTALAKAQGEIEGAKKGNPGKPMGGAGGLRKSKDAESAGH